MKKVSLWLVAVGVLCASNISDIKNADFIKIEKNVSKNFATKIEKKAKQKGIDLILNPKLGCLDFGFSKKDIFAQGVMMGTNRSDGSLEVGGTGDFEAYSYIRYQKGNKECIETTYTKEYDPNRYGEYSYMVYK